MAEATLGDRPPHLRPAPASPKPPRCVRAGPVCERLPESSSGALCGLMAATSKSSVTTCPAASALASLQALPWTTTPLVSCDSSCLGHLAEGLCLATDHRAGQPGDLAGCRGPGLLLLLIGLRRPHLLLQLQLCPVSVQWSGLALPCLALVPQRIMGSMGLCAGEAG